jgi:four helix bundle protein
VADPIDKREELEDRLVEFAARIVRLTASLGRTAAARHIAEQLLRCGTSPAANYAEARSAESRNDFAHKVAIVEKELRETQVWLKILVKSEIVPDSKLSPLIDETGQLVKIFGATLSSLRGIRKATVK